ncbi:hypothetical protein CLU79DRAFT_462584 [Phycomyces nitens]|nr:hypothetical protein CLU79DRAFT_462584 [Phycomyces nitens]
MRKYQNNLLHKQSGKWGHIQIQMNLVTATTKDLDDVKYLGETFVTSCIFFNNSVAQLEIPQHTCQLNACLEPSFPTTLHLFLILFSLLNACLAGVALPCLSSLIFSLLNACLAGVVLPCLSSLIFSLLNACLAGVVLPCLSSLIFSIEFVLIKNILT